MANSKLTTLDQLKMQAERIKLELNKYVLDTELETAVDTAISETGAAKTQIVESIPEAGSAAANTIYIYHNTGTNDYEMHYLVDGVMVRLDNDAAGTVPESQIATDEEVTSMLDEVFPQA